jgi:hypothetical protein
VFSLLLLAIRFFDPLVLVIAGDVLLVGIYVFEMVVIGKLSRMVKNQSKPLLLTQTIREQSWFGSIVALLLLPNVFDFSMQMGDSANRIHYLLQVITVICFFLASLAYRRVGTEAIMQARQNFPEAFVK